MMTRRGAALGFSSLAWLRPALSQPAPAQSTMPAPGKRAWAAEIPVIRMGLLGGENDADRLARVDGYKKLMETTFQVPVKLMVAPGCAASTSR